MSVLVWFKQLFGPDQHKTELLCVQAFREEVQISLQGCQAQCSYVLGTGLSMFDS